MRKGDWLYMAVKRQKSLTANKNSEKKKHKILWFLEDLKGICCGELYPFYFELCFGKEVLRRLSHISILFFLL